jgi:hypothetical protein
MLPVVGSKQAICHPESHQADDSDYSHVFSITYMNFVPQPTNIFSPLGRADPKSCISSYGKMDGTRGTELAG